jgi:hypothetical protein
MLEVDERVFRPELFSQLISRDKSAASRDQRFEQSQRLFGKDLAVAVVRQLARVHIQLERTNAHAAGGCLIEHH